MYAFSQEFRMTKTTRAGCKTGPLQRADGISAPTSFGDLIRGGRRNLDSTTSQVMPHHQNALIVQHGYSCWIQKLPAAEITSCLRRFLHPLRTPGRVCSDNSRDFITACQDLQRILTMRILFSSLRNQWYRRKSCSTSTRRKSNNIDVSKWLSRRVMGLCNGVVLPLAEHARQDGRWQDTMRGVTYDGPLIPCGATFSHKLTSLKSRASAAAVRPKDASWNPHELCLTCETRMVR